MKWTKALATGNEIIDEQHRGLFRCLEQLEIATAEQRTLLAVYSITRLKHYIREHFETEEAVMRQCNFPKLQEHIAEHQNFRAKMTALQGQAVILDVSAEMVEFLADWLTKHVAESDL
ncbi:MAG: bacteriohemerythrin, partial [Sterolibacterium sp.]